MAAVPPYAYYTHMCLTSLPENFNKTKVACSALNHHSLGDICNWFLRAIAKICVNPEDDNQNKISIKPNFINSLNFAQGSYKAPDSDIFVKWERKADEMLLSVKATGNLSFAFKLPKGCKLKGEIENVEAFAEYRISIT